MKGNPEHNVENEMGNQAVQMLKARLSPNRSMSPVTLRMPDDVVSSLKQIAPLRGFSGYQALLKHYVSEGLREDEAKYLYTDSPNKNTKLLMNALKKHGVSEAVLQAAYREVHEVV